MPGNDGELAGIARYLSEHRAEYEESRRRSGVTMERAYAMRTPGGTIVTAYIEATGDPGSTIQAQVSSTLPIDKWFFATLAGIHGIDFTKPPAGPPPELLFDWVDPQVTRRDPGIAFTAPIAQGKIDQGRAFAKEAFVTRVNELTDSRRRIRGTHEFAMLSHTPMGAFVSVYIEGQDPREANRAFARSTSPFDVWFKKEAGDVLAQDFGQPLPPIDTIWEWSAQREPAAA